VILRTVSVFCAFLSVVQGGPCRQQGDPPAWSPTIRSDVREVVVPVVVTDKSGRYITHLDREDFAVLEDGIFQKIINFRRSALTRSSEAATGSTAQTPIAISPTTSTEENPKRTYLICLDTLHSSFSDFKRMRDALTQFFAQEHSDDSQYALMALGRNLHVVVDSTRDPQIILIALQSKSLLKTIRDSDASNIALEVDRFAQAVQHWCENCQCTNTLMDLVGKDAGGSCIGLKQPVASALFSFPNRAYVTNRGFLTNSGNW